MAVNSIIWIVSHTLSETNCSSNVYETPERRHRTDYCQFYSKRAQILEMCALSFRIEKPWLRISSVFPSMRSVAKRVGGDGSIIQRNLARWTQDYLRTSERGYGLQCAQQTAVTGKFTKLLAQTR